MLDQETVVMALASVVIGAIWGWRHGPRLALALVGLWLLAALLHQLAGRHLLGEAGASILAARLPDTGLGVAAFACGSFGFWLLQRRRRAAERR